MTGIDEPAIENLAASSAHRRITGAGKAEIDSDAATMDYDIGDGHVTRIDIDGLFMEGEWHKFELGVFHYNRATAGDVNSGDEMGGVCTPEILDGHAVDGDVFRVENVNPLGKLRHRPVLDRDSPDVQGDYAPVYFPDGGIA
jgi:hypothetical protein